jgi:hypothetical protein
VSRAASYVTAGVLAAIGGLHLAWGRGSSFPFGSSDELVDSVIGSGSVPSPRACQTVAGALFVASALVADVPVAPRRVRQLGRYGVASVLGLRGALGLCGRTDVVSPASTSPRFRAMDRRLYSPLCLALAAGAASA